MGFRIANLLLE